VRVSECIKEMIKSHLESAIRLVRNYAGKNPGWTQDSAAVLNVAECVRKVSAEDLGVIQSEYVSRRDRYIEYINVGECEDLTMCVFILPPLSRIPLHDHPQMTVFSKVLWGDLEIESYDLIKPVDTFGRALGKSNPKTRLKTAEVAVTYRDKSNVHTFLAHEWTAVFDILVPPYDVAHGRPCHYFSDPSNISSSTNQFSEDSKTVVLREAACPDWFHTVRGEYRGSNIGLNVD